MQVQLKNFKGPLELLLELVEKSKIDIEDIIIADITQSFLEAMQNIQISMDEITGFIDIASTLLLIKSKSLLPTPEAEEEGQVTKAQLIARLKLYRQYREAAKILAQIAQNKTFQYGKKRDDLELYKVDSAFVIEKNVSELKRVYIDLLSRDQLINDLKDSIVDQVMDVEHFSVSETLIRLLSQLDFDSLSSLRSYIHTNQTKSELIALFLSVLELIKAGEVTCVQFDRVDLFVRRIK